MAPAKRLNIHQSDFAFRLQEYSPGTYIQILDIHGNSFISSVFINAVNSGGNVQVNFYDTTLGDQFGERYNIGSHELIDETNVGQTARKQFALFHNKVICELIVTSAPATVGVFLTSVTSGTNQSYSVIPNEDFGYQVAYLAADDATIDQNINVNKIFKWTAQARTLIRNVSLVVVSVNANSIIDYGNKVGGLTNGIRIYTSVGPFEFEYFNIKRFVDFVHISEVQTGSIKVNGSTTETTFLGRLLFKDPLVVSKGTVLNCQIRDDLSNILYQRATILYSEI